ncbi:gamma-soluble NSF attachment protein-like [Agrilus planipennis]|uniref:Gamma-soluble NSF attachment protein n=1 Tax=Agrilus planipennis TaxID=224129 RepID=A0A1W4WGC4_AGRPL|nr:gamma-soluble NSF attachment protein-like [Agrilus planipennis]
MNISKKIEEGLEHIRVAEKNLKTSFLKWRPDYELAAEEYNKAATCFRNAKSFEQCKECLLKASDCHKQNRSFVYLQMQDSVRQSAEYMSKVSRLHVKLKQYDLAADAIRREIGLLQQTESYQATGRLAVALVLVQLAREDVVAAEKAFKEWGNYCEGPEVQTLEMLLQAYDDEDPDVAKKALNNPFIKHMDVEYAILARDLKLPEGISCPPKATVRENAAPSYVSPNLQTTATIEEHTPEEVETRQITDNLKPGNDEEEFEGSLC